MAREWLRASLAELSRGHALPTGLFRLTCGFSHFVLSHLGSTYWIRPNKMYRVHWMWAHMPAIYSGQRGIWNCNHRRIASSFIVYHVLLRNTSRACPMDLTANVGASPRCREASDERHPCSSEGEVTAGQCG
jgi:hypothetical protein